MLIRIDASLLERLIILQEFIQSLHPVPGCKMPRALCIRKPRLLLDVRLFLRTLHTVQRQKQVQALQQLLASRNRLVS